MNSEPQTDDILGVCATYGTPVLGTDQQEHFIAGFKHSRTYREASSALAALIAQAAEEGEARGRLAEVQAARTKFINNATWFHLNVYLNDRARELTAHEPDNDPFAPTPGDQDGGKL